MNLIKNKSLRAGLAWGRGEKARFPQPNEIKEFLKKILNKISNDFIFGAGTPNEA